MRSALVALFLLSCTTVAPAQPAQPQAPGLTVTGQGVAEVMPDQATVAFTVLAEEKLASEAQERVNGIMNRVMKAVTGLGIKTEALSTTGISLWPLCPETQGTPRKPGIAGYRASNGLQVRLDDLARIGPVIDAAVKAGVNGIEGVTFGLKDDREARRAALAAATRDARLRADAVAAALGVEIVGVDEVNESGLVVPFMRKGIVAFAAESATPVQPGQLRVEAVVSVRYRIDGKIPPTRPAR